MPRKAATVLTTLLVFNFASVVLADTPVSMVSEQRTATDTATPLTAQEKALYAASQRDAVQNSPFRRDGIGGGTMIWITLTEPGGKPVYINVEHVTSIRSHTQIPGARAQLDLASGKFQGVQEDAEHIMQLISANSGARENDGPPRTNRPASSS